LLDNFRWCGNIESKDFVIVFKMPIFRFAL